MKTSDLILSNPNSSNHAIAANRWRSAARLKNELRIVKQRRSRSPAVADFTLVRRVRVQLIAAFIFPYAYLVMPHALAVDQPKSDAYKAYMEHATTTAIHAVRTELAKQARPVEDVSLKLAFQVDPAGHVHNVKVSGNKANQSAEETARRVLSNLKLPRFPQNVANEVGNTSIDITAPLVIRPVHTGNKSVKPDSPETVAYLMRCNEIIMSMLDAEVVKHRGDLKGTLEIILLLDPKGHIRAQKIIATPAYQWLEEMAMRVVRDAKLPAMPAQVVAEHKGDLVPFATQWVYERRN
jgi:hypothetical protein